MSNRSQQTQWALLALPALTLLGYAFFILRTYWPYLNLDLRLRSRELAGLPEDVVGFGFWTWWPFVTLLLLVLLAAALSGSRRRLYVAASFLAVFAMLSVADYLLYQRLVQELIRF